MPLSIFRRRSPVLRRKPSSRINFTSLETLEQRTLLSVNPVSRIVNGTITTGYPSVGIVGESGKGFCSGTLISTIDVLTAAHCLVFVSNTSGSFEVGGQTYDSAEVVVHPDYNPLAIGSDGANDIAIMRLDTPVAGVTPSGLQQNSPSIGQLLTIVGFGAGGTGLTGHDSTFGTKREGETRIDGITTTLVTWNFDNNFESNTAPGDSGGPNFLRHGTTFLVAAITSGGIKADASIGDISFSTRVDHYLGWINSVLNAQVGSSPGLGGGSGAGAGSLLGGIITGAPFGGGGTGSPFGGGASGQPFGGGGGGGPFGSVGGGAPFGGGGTGAPFGGKLTLSSRLVDSLEYRGVSDYMTFTPLSSGPTVFRVDAKSGTLDSGLAVYDSEGNLVGENDDHGQSRNSRVRISVKAGETYRLEVRGVGASGGKYQISSSRAGRQAFLDPKEAKKAARAEAKAEKLRFKEAKKAEKVRVKAEKKAAQVAAKAERNRIRNEKTIARNEAKAEKQALKQLKKLEREWAKEERLTAKLAKKNAK